MLQLAAALVTTSTCALAQPKPPEIVCDLTTVPAGRMDGQVLRTEGVTVPG